MKKTIFRKLREVNTEEMFPMLKVGDIFLYGKSVILQKEVKQVGQPITYYKVVEANGSNINYAPIYDILEED